MLALTLGAVAYQFSISHIIRGSIAASSSPTPAALRSRALRSLRVWPRPHPAALEAACATNLPERRPRQRDENATLENTPSDTRALAR